MAPTPILCRLASCTLLITGALGIPGCATQGTAGRVDLTRIEGTVLDAQSGVPIEGARVALCQQEPKGAVVFESWLNLCDMDLASTSTDRAGSFRLQWAPGNTLVGLMVEFRSTGYLPVKIPAATLPSVGHSSNLTIRLRAMPTVDLKVVGEDGKPMGKAGLGWLVEEAGTIRARYSPYCSDDQGKGVIGLDGVPEGEVTLFMTTGGKAPHFGTRTITTKAGGRYSVTLKAEKPLLVVSGRVVDAEGLPLAAVVSVEPSPPKYLSALDRVLLEVRGTDTDTDGSFEFRIASPAPVLLRLWTWVGRGIGTEHVRLAPLAEAAAEFGMDPTPVVLKAPEASVVRCTLLGPNNARLGMVEIGLSFVPHQAGSGHSGSCVWPGGKGSADEDPKRKYPQEVSFIWPSGAKTVLVTARSTARSTSGTGRPYVGEIALSRATDPCQIRGM